MARPVLDVGDAEELRDELAAIATALRSYVKWQAASGATGLPRDPDARQRAAEAWISAEETSTPAVGAPPRADEPVGHQQPVGHRQLPPPPPERTSRQHESPQSRAPSGRPGEGSPGLVAPAGPKLKLPPASSHLPAALEDLAEAVSRCTACELSKTRSLTVFSRGTGTSGLCFVGEGPGADEDAAGLPFVGKAGQLLDRMIGAMGFSREEVYVMNVVKCRPPENRKPHAEEMAACSGFLHRQLELLGPEIIVALGATAVEGLLGQSGGITKLRGKFRLYRGQIAVMPTFHPAYLLRNPAAKKEVWSDLQQVVQHMGRVLPPQK